MISETDKAYLAGFLDGESHIGITRSKARPNGEWHCHYLIVTLSNTHLETLSWVRALWGGALVIRLQPQQRIPIGNLRWSSASAVRVLRDVEPYLKIKRAQATLALQFGAAIEARQGHPTRFTTKDEWNQREELRLAMRQINRPDSTLKTAPYPARATTKVCVACGKSFEMPYRGNRMYCSKHCVYVAKWQREKAKHIK